MGRYVVLLRGINVGGLNPVSMAALQSCIEELGCTAVATLLASGNVVLQSTKSAATLSAEIEAALPSKFKLDTASIRVLVLSAAQFLAMIDDRPRGFGDEADKYHSDAIFLMGIKPADALLAFDPRDGVDTVWAGKGIIYHQRLSARRTKTRLNKMMGTPAYKSMTIRSWQTVQKLAGMLA